MPDLRRYWAAEVSQLPDPANIAAWLAQKKVTAHQDLERWLGGDRTANISKGPLVEAEIWRPYDG